MNSGPTCPFYPTAAHFPNAREAAVVRAMVRAFQDQSFTVWHCVRALLRFTRLQGLRSTGFSKRHCTDTLIPTAPTHFLPEFIGAGRNVGDVRFESPPEGIGQKHPTHLFYAFFGYFFSHRSELSGYFRTHSMQGAV